MKPKGETAHAAVLTGSAAAGDVLREGRPRATSAAASADPAPIPSATRKPASEGADTGPNGVVMWARTTPMTAAETEGPLKIWQQWAPQATGKPIDSGHFLTEENPEATAAALADFFAGYAGDR